MPKVLYTQKFRDAWLQASEFKAWIRKDETDLTKAYCSYCKCSIKTKLFDLRAHAETKKHISASSCFSQSNKISFSRMPKKQTEQEAALCLFIAEHTAIAQIDHLSRLCVHNFGACPSAAKIRLGRTKCTSIINNVLAQHFDEDLTADIGDSNYSLLLDESTDVSVTKLVGVAINYFSVKCGAIVSTFLSLIPIESGDAVSIAEGVRQELVRLKININKMVGIGTDNASVMTGVKRSVYTELKKDVPSLILIKCVCHSVQLSVNHACAKCLPDQLEFLIHDTYSWFSKSSKRQINYKKIYQSINDDKVLVFVQMFRSFVSCDRDCPN
ncbi:uncharacterized protein LOC6493163 isoform X3 [Drosophila ananassae]|uniref:uncharacterized protein LOC6493163 isoform X3 n=1 Tax=Drosophila ananassae TaxID=7217 RepID=UPI0013A5ED74|nr:uncharacterized protein LOC6493163 isoform X3 [Drosophila ananassae]